MINNVLITGGLKMSKKVLIVDDKEDNRIILKNFFNFFGRDSGIDLYYADNSKDAYDIIKKEKPDLVLLDIFMETRTSGLEVARKVRKELSNEKIALWALTAQAMAGTEGEESDEQKCLNAGCDKYFSKPFDQRALLIEVSELLGVSIPERIKKRMNIE